MLVGEAAGEQEIKHSIPFYDYAPAGSLLKRVLGRIGISRDLFTITNVVWSHPSNDWLSGAPWEAEAVEAYRPLLDDLIERTKPKVIVAMGETALRRLTIYGGGKASITNVRGYVTRCTGHDCWVIPTFHPSFIQRGAHQFTSTLVWDISRALDIAHNGFIRKPVEYITHPVINDAEKFFQQYELAGMPPLSFDIETPESQDIDEEEMEDREDISYTIIRISFSFQQRHAISFPWQEPFIRVARRLLSSSGPKRVWNGPFDMPRLEAAGCPINGRVYDVMDLWKHLQPSLRKALGMVAPFYGWDLEPWKHMSQAQPEWYSCADSDALSRVGDGVERDLKAINLWNSVERHVVDLSAILRQMSKNGLPVSQERLEEMRQDFTSKLAERVEELQKVAPEPVRLVYPKDGYKKPPKEGTPPPGTVVDKDENPIVREVLLANCPLIQRQFNSEDACGCLSTTLCSHRTRWAWLVPFNPNSWQQVQAYCKLRRYALGRNRKTKKETTDEDTLKRLIRRHKDPLLKLTLECRKLTKVLSTYIEGWTPARDGCVHPTHSFRGKMYRISWRRPNIGATIADKDEEAIAKGFRRCVMAPPGHLLVEGDWRGIEAVLVGWFAEDPEYMRLARLGVHSYLLSHMLGEPAELSWSDDDLEVLFHDLKRSYRQRYDDAKHCIHGTNYGMGPRLMAQQYDMAEAEAKRLQAMYFDLFPKVKMWQNHVIDMASRQAKLTLPFGYPMWFWDVQRWDSNKGKYVMGEDAKSAVSFLPRDTAAFILRECLLRMSDWANCHILLGCIHDSILMCVPSNSLDDVARRLKTEMETPIPQLGGLVINAEIKYGRSWHDDDMEVWRP